MRNYNEPQAVPGVFTPEECDRIIKFIKRQSLTEGTIYQKFVDKYASIVDVNVRSARNFLFADEESWVRDRLRAASRKINDEWFQFDLTTTAPDRLVGVHYPLGGHFGPHVDNISNEADLYKKLTCVVQLSDPADYEGGDLRFAPEWESPRERGTMICFPTYLRHMVSPVTQGERFVLINWCVSETHFK